MPKPVPVAQKIHDERNGLTDGTPTSTLRARLLQGKPVNLVEVADELDANMANLQSSLNRMRGIGFDVERVEPNIYVLNNPDHEPSPDASQDADKENEKLRRRIVKLLRKGQEVTPDLVGVTPHKLGSHVRYLRATMAIERIPGPVAKYALKADELVDEDDEGDEAEAPAHHPVPVNGNGHDHRAPARTRIPQIDDELRVYFVARESEDTVLVGAMGADGPVQLYLHA